MTILLRLSDMESLEKHIDDEISGVRHALRYSNVSDEHILLSELDEAMTVVYNTLIQLRENHDFIS